MMQLGTLCDSIITYQREDLRENNIEGLHQEVFIGTLINMTSLPGYEGNNESG